MPLVIVVGAAVLVVLWVIATYNSLVSGRNRVRNAWAHIDVQLKRRHDLIPNLVETVKGYAQHEAGTLEAVIKARAAAVGARSVAQTAQAEAGISGALAGLFAVAERYPELRANQSFLALQEELTSTENRIGFARQAYNDEVLSFNNLRETFPNNLLAGSFEKAESFELADAAERTVPKVQFTAAS